MRHLFVTILALAPAIVIAQGSQGPTPNPLDSPPPARAAADALVEVTNAEDAETVPEGEPSAAADAESIAEDVGAAGSELPTPPGATATAAMTEPEAVEPPPPLPEAEEDPWSVDGQFAEDEVAAFEEADPFRPSGTIGQADELFKTATVQLETSEYRDAEQALTDGIDIVEQQVGRYDPTLVDPLTLLGDSRYGQGDFPGALDAYERAIHVTRVNDGLHSARQVEIIYKEADSWAAMGDLDKANDRHEYAYDMLLRNYGPNSVELVPGMYKLAHWYSRNHDIFSARGLYQYAARALSMAYGGEDLRLIPALQGIAQTYKSERFPPYRPPDQASISLSSSASSSGARVQARPSVNRFGDGERALQQIVRIQEANPDATVGDIAVAILDLADWNLMFENWERAYTLYEFSYEILNDQGGVSAEDVVTYFAEPRPLYLPLPNDPRPPSNLSVVPTIGYVELTYLVTDRGTVHDLQTTASEPKGLMDFKVRKAVRAARFRPQLVEGRPVATPNLVYRHRFQYYPVQQAPEGGPEAEATVATDVDTDPAG